MDSSLKIVHAQLALQHVTDTVCIHTVLTRASLVFQSGLG